MGTIFTLTPSVKAVIQAALDDLITELGKTCVLFYPPIMTICANCVFDPIGQKSSNHWLSGGPIPFSAGNICPLCSGEGRHAEERSTSLQLLCSWKPKDFWVPVPNIRVPTSVMQTKGYLVDMQKVVNASYLQLEVAGFVQRYELMQAPSDQSNIIQGRYFIATWKQRAE